MIKIFNVKGMHCPSCEMLIQDSLEEIDGIASAKLDYEKGTATVDFDEKSVSVEQIKTAIKQEGYEV